MLINWNRKNFLMTSKSIKYYLQNSAYVVQKNCSLQLMKSYYYIRGEFYMFKNSVANTIDKTNLKQKMHYIIFLNSNHDKQLHVIYF